MPISKSHYPLLAAICASLFTTPLMMAGVNAVLPEIGKSFSASGTQLALVGACYSLGLAVFQLVSGSLGDIAGHRGVFLVGALLFCLTSACGAAATGMEFFLVCRLGQGIGGALLGASGLALMAACAPPEERPAYLGVSGAAVYAGIACGPPVAGFLTAAVSWRSIFWINAVCSIAVFLAMKYGASQNWRPAAKCRFDWQGAVLYGCAMAGLTATASLTNDNPTTACLAAAASILFLIFFILRERSAPFPVLDLALLKANRVLRFSAVAAFVNYSSMFGLLFYFSFFLQTALGLNVAESGLILGIQALAQMLSTPMTIKLNKKYRAPFLAAWGSGLCAFGLLAAAFLSPASPLWVLIAAQILLGCGISLFSLANTNLIIESGGKKGIGQTSALTGAVRTAGQLASMIFVTLSIGWFLGAQAISPATLAGFMQSMKSSLIVFGLLNLAGIACALINNSSDQTGVKDQS